MTELPDMRDRIVKALGADADRVTLHVYDSVTSTNTLLRQLADAGAPDGTVIIARQQTAGKGRQGRAFFSPPDSGLYLSMLLRPDLRPDALSELTPMAAVAAAEAAEAVSGQRVQIKWVNDLLLRGKKVCGILAETAFSGGDYYVVIGIGINLTEPPGGFPPELREIAGAVCAPGTDPDAALVQCAASLTAALLRGFAGLAEKRYLAGYRARLCGMGQPITVIENGTETPAVALGIDDSVRLHVRYPDGTEQWRATGEIRIVLIGKNEK
jgi:BirA family biotin operon repressor/biotin-[acetyl-CoA-carboxylase] ligase